MAALGIVEESKPVPWLEGIKGDKLPRLILSNSKVIRVIAGPGSGKTLGVQRRVQRLIAGDGVDPQRILIGSFTREITRQLAAAVGEAAVDRVSTIHSLAFQLLRQNPGARQGRALRALLNYEVSPMLYDIGDAHPNLGDQNTRKKLLRELEAAYAKRRTLNEAAFIGELDRWLRYHGGMLVDEFVPFATRALESGDIPQGQFDHVIIDEYQDLTECEQVLVALVWSQNGSLVVLGDDDQSIYGFRNNHPTGITGFASRWAQEELEDLTLPENHRSGANIVDVANRMMAEAGSAKPPMDSRFDGTDSLALVYWLTVEDEVAGLARYVQSQSPAPYLILVPLKIIGYRLRDAIGKEARTSFSEEVLDSNEARERFTLASLVADPDDAIALRVWLGLRADSPDHAPNWNVKAYGSAKASGERGRRLAEAIASDKVTVVGQGKSNVVARAKSLLHELSSAPEALTEAIDWLFDPRLARSVEDTEKRRLVARDLHELRQAAHLVSEYGGASSLRDVIDRLRYRIATRAPLDNEDPPRVRITTLHSAKGLEADRVVVAGLADEIIPGRLQGEAEREEKRRLLYVAITRAKTELILSRPQNIKYADALSNNVRIGPSAIRTLHGERHVRLSMSTLIPSDFPARPQHGEHEWLDTMQENR